MQFGYYAQVCPEQEKEVRISPANEPSKQYREEDSELYSEQEDFDSFRHYLIRKFTIPYNFLKARRCNPLNV